MAIISALSSDDANNYDSEESDDRDFADIHTDSEESDYEKFAIIRTVSEESGDYDTDYSDDWDFDTF